MLDRMLCMLVAFSVSIFTLNTPSNFILIPGCELLIIDTVDVRPSLLNNAGEDGTSRSVRSLPLILLLLEIHERRVHSVQHVKNNTTDALINMNHRIINPRHAKSANNESCRVISCRPVRVYKVHYIQSVRFDLISYLPRSLLRERLQLVGILRC